MNEPRMVNIIVLQNMLQKCFNMSQLPSPNEGLVFIGIFLFLLLESLCGNLKSYDNPLWGFY